MAKAYKQLPLPMPGIEVTSKGQAPQPVPGVYSEEQAMQSASRVAPGTQYDWQLAFQQLVDYQVGISALRKGKLKVSRTNLQGYFLAMMVELGELVQELNWKPWQDKAKHVDLFKVEDEWADCMAFFLLITDLVCQGGRTTPHELINAYIRKSKVNEQRMLGLVSGYEKGDGDEDSQED